MVKAAKHIAICSTSYYEYDRRLQRITKTLAEAGYKLSWLSRKKDSSSKPLPYLNHIIINTKNSRGPSFYREYNQLLKKELIKLRPDIINSIDLDTILGCYKAKQKLGCRITHDAHEIYYEVPELLNKPVKKGIWKLLAKRYLPKIDVNYTVNQSLKNHYESAYKQSYEVIRNVPSAEQSQAKKTKPKINNKTLIYLGVLNKGRGIEIAISAMRELTEYKLLLVGEGDNSQQLRESAANLSNVKFLGYRQPQELAELLEEASIGLNILQAESLNYKLSLANKFFDYMHAGLPSINMAYPEYQHIISQYTVGLMIESYDEKALVSAIRQLENREKYYDLSKSALDSRTQFTWESEQAKLLNIYNSI